MITLSKPFSLLVAGCTAGLATGIYQTIPFSIFLKYGDAKTLATMLVFSSILMIFKGALFGFLKKVLPDLDFLKLENTTALALSFLSIVCYFILPNVLFAYTLILLQFALQAQGPYSWMLSTTQTLTLDENKRHYGGINAANSGGKILGFCLVPFLIWLMTEPMVLFVALVFQIITSILLKHVRLIANEQIKNTKAFSSSSATWNQKESTLVSFALTLMLIAIVIVYNATVNGYQALKALIPAEGQFAFYLSGVNLLRSVIEFFSRLSYPSLIKAVGILGGFSMLPLSYFLFFGLYLSGVNTLILGIITWIFIFTTLNAFCTPTFFHIISVIPPSKRASCMNIFGNILTPAGSMLGNGLFVLTFALYPDNSTPHHLFLFILSILIIAIIFFVKRPYLQQLKILVTKNISSPFIEALSKEGEKVVVQKLGHANAKELLYFLSQSHKFSKPLKSQIYDEAFKSQNPFVLTALLKEKIPKTPEHIEELHKLLKTSCEKVKVLAYRKLQEMEALSLDEIKGTFLETLKEMIETQNSELIASNKQLLPFCLPGEISMPILEKMYIESPEQIAPLLLIDKKLNIETFFVEILKMGKAEPFFERLKQVPQSAPQYIKLTLEHLDTKTTPWEGLMDLIALQPPEIAFTYLNKLLNQVEEFRIQRDLFEILSLPSNLLITSIDQLFLDKVKRKLFNEIEQLEGIKNVFSSNPILFYSSKISIKESYQTLLSIWAIETKESTFKTLNLWDQPTDPFQKSFINEFLTYNLSKKDFSKLRQLNAQKVNIEKILQNSRFSDVLKAGLIYELKYKKQIHLENPSKLIQETITWVQQ
jgi:hypothetical protein